MKKAIKKVSEGKNNYYLECYAFAVKFIKKHSSFTSEDIIDSDVKKGANLPKEPRVWGAVMNELAKKNFIFSSGYFTPYRKKSGHSKPTREWKSNILK